LSRALEIAPVRKTLVIEASPERTFEVFTAGIDRWWPKTHTLGSTPLVRSVIEPFVGGRWYSVHADGSQVTVGHVRAWQPGVRLVLGWEISADWKPEARVAFSSEVEVRFIAIASGRTRLELEHRHFERMGAQAGAKMRHEVDGGWPKILELLAQEVARGEAACQAT
jgi:uncharacterized protein YndB with AHSA1/START domain